MDTCNLYILDGGTTQGPFSLRQIFELIKDGLLHSSAMFAQDGAQNWNAIATLDQQYNSWLTSLTPAKAPQPPIPVPPQPATKPPFTGKHYPTTSATTYSTATTGGAVVPAMGHGLAVLGWWFIFGGVIASVFFVLMRVDVPSGDILERVSNLGLMNTRVCGMIASVGLTLLGGLLLVVDAIKTRQ